MPDGWISPRFGFERGFDVFEARQDADAADEAMRAALEDRPRGRPLFLFLHLFDAHCGNLTHPDSTIYDSPPEYAELYSAGAADRIRGQGVHDIYYGEKRPTKEQAHDIVALYDSGVRMLDDYLREWHAFWESEGLLDNALVIVTSDHGEALGAKGLWRGHGGFFEHGLRVPLVVRYPDGFGAGTEDDRLTSSVDLVPTVLDLLELEPESWVAGRSLLDAPRSTEDVILAERDRLRVVTNGRFKMLWSLDGGEPEIWDLREDPLESKPLEVELGRPIRRGLLGRLAPLDARTAETPGRPIPAGEASDATREALDALGYAGE